MTQHGVLGALSVINKQAGGLAKQQGLLLRYELPPVSAPRRSAVVWGNRSWLLVSYTRQVTLPSPITGNVHTIYRPHAILSPCLCLMWSDMLPRWESFWVYFGYFDISQPVSKLTIFLMFAESFSFLCCFIQSSTHKGLISYWWYSLEKKTFSGIFSSK